MSTTPRSKLAFRDLGRARYLVVASLIASIGFGMYVPGSLLFFTRVVGLSLAEVGLGLSLAGVVGLLSSVFAGRMADRVGARRLVVIAGLSQAVLLVLLTQVGSLALFMVVVTLLAIAEQAGNVARSALVAAVAEGGLRVTTNAYMRSAFNLGATVGVLVSGTVIALNRPVGYYGLVLGNAVLSALAVLIVSMVGTAHSRQPRAQGEGSRWEAVRDRPYVAVALLCGVLSLVDVVLSVGLPLWIVGYTVAPRVLAGWLLGVNTVIIVLLQVWASRGIDTPLAARRRLAAAGVVSAGGCVAIGLAHGLPAVAAAGTLLVGVVTLSLSELWSLAAAWQLRYSLAREHLQGEYAGVFNLASGVRTVVGPILITTLMTGLRTWGWVTLAAVFLVFTTFVGPAVRWAEDTRKPEPELPLNPEAAVRDESGAR